MGEASTAAAVLGVVLDPDNGVFAAGALVAVVLLLGVVCDEGDHQVWISV